MKIRHDFVTNSSSSSFIVVFPERPESTEEVKAMLFPDQDSIMSPWGDASYPVEQISSTVMRDIKEQDDGYATVDIWEIARLMSHGYFEGRPEYPEYDYNRTTPAQREKIWAKHERRVEDWALKEARKFLGSLKSQGFIYKFHYADEDGEYGSMLEHGNIFRALPHMRISHH